MSVLPQHGGVGAGRDRDCHPTPQPYPRGGWKGLWMLWVPGRGLIRAGRRGLHRGQGQPAHRAPSLPIPLHAKGSQNIPGLPGRCCVSAELHAGTLSRP